MLGDKPPESLTGLEFALYLLLRFAVTFTLAYVLIRILKG